MTSSISVAVIRRTRLRRASFSPHDGDNPQASEELSNTVRAALGTQLGLGSLGHPPGGTDSDARGQDHHVRSLAGMSAAAYVRTVDQAVSTSRCVCVCTLPRILPDGWVHVVQSDAKVLVSGELAQGATDAPIFRAVCRQMLEPPFRKGVFLNQS